MSILWVNMGWSFQRNLISAIRVTKLSIVPHFDLNLIWFWLNALTLSKTVLTPVRDELFKKLMIKNWSEIVYVFFYLLCVFLQSTFSLDFDQCVCVQINTYYKFCLGSIKRLFKYLGNLSFVCVSWFVYTQKVWFLQSFCQNSNHKKLEFVII